MLPPSAAELRISHSAPGSPATSVLQDSNVFTPASISSSSAYNGCSSLAAGIYQLSSVINKPKVIVTNGAQVKVNGQSGLTQLANGAVHVDMKKDSSSQNPGIHGVAGQHAHLSGSMQGATVQQLAAAAQAGQQAAHQLMSALASQNTSMTATMNGVFNQVSQSSVLHSGHQQPLALISQSGVHLVQRANSQTVSLQQLQQHFQQQQQQYMINNQAGHQPVLLTTLGNAQMSIASKRALGNNDFKHTNEEPISKQMRQELAEMHD